MGVADRAPVPWPGGDAIRPNAVTAVIDSSEVTTIASVETRPRVPRPRPRSRASGRTDRSDRSRKRLGRARRVAGLVRGRRSNCVRVRKPRHCPKCEYTGKLKNFGRLRFQAPFTLHPSCGHSASSTADHGRLPVEAPDGGLRASQSAPLRGADLERRRGRARQVTSARLLPPRPKTGGARDAGDARLLGRVQRGRRPLA